MSEIIEAEAADDYTPAIREPGTLFGTDDPSQVITAATAAAKALADVLNQRRLYTSISGRNHVLVEGWTLLGSMLGVYAVPIWTRPLHDDAGTYVGWEARVEARTRDGAVVGAAEAEVRTDERNWRNRESYALRSMAQTRATSKALRLPLGFVVSLAGYEPTPAEELTDTSTTTQPIDVSADPKANQAEVVDAVFGMLPDLDPREKRDKTIVWKAWIEPVLAELLIDNELADVDNTKAAWAQLDADTAAYLIATIADNIKASGSEGADPPPAESPDEPPPSAAGGPSDPDPSAPTPNGGDTPSPAGALSLSASDRVGADEVGEGTALGEVGGPDPTTVAEAVAHLDAAENASQAKAALEPLITALGWTMRHIEAVGGPPAGWPVDLRQTGGAAKVQKVERELRRQAAKVLEGSEG